MKKITRMLLPLLLLAGCTHINADSVCRAVAQKAGNCCIALGTKKVAKVVHTDQSTQPAIEIAPTTFNTFSLLEWNSDMLVW